MLGFAEEYRQAAELVRSRAEIPPMPAYMLMGQSIELALKAYLLSRGVPLSELRRHPFGHDLEVLLSTAFRLRLDRLVQRFELLEQVVRSLNVGYKTHDFRYIRTGIKTVPYWEFLSPVAKGLTLGLHDHCLRRRLGKAAASELKTVRGRFAHVEIFRDI